MSPLIRHRWVSRVVRFLAACLVLLALAATWGWFYGRDMAAGIVQKKLQALVAQQLNARLDIGRLRYRWPYGVEVTDAALYSTTPGEPSIKLVGFDRLDLQLHRLPFRKGPLVIERIDVRAPTLYVVETKADGFVGLKHLLRDPSSVDGDARPKLSDVLRLRHVQLTDARIEYDDGTIRKSVPFVWDKLGLNLDGESLSKSAYHFKAGAGNGDTARVDADGSIDVDALELTLDRLDLTARLAPGQRNSPLPAGVQRVLNTLHVSGGGRATLSGRVPFMHTKDLDLHGDFVIDDAQGRLSPEGRPLSDLDISGGIGMKGRDVTVDVRVFSCIRGPVGVSVQPVTVTYALATDRWTTTPVRAAVAYVPPWFATGTLRQRATVLLTAELTELKARDEFRVNVEGTRILLPDAAAELTAAGVVRYDDEGVTVEGLRLIGLGGTTTIAGFLNDDVSSFVGEIGVDDADLAALNRVVDPEATHALTGRVSGNLKGGVTESLDAIRGEGHFRVTGGTFAKVPVLGGLADKLKVGQNAFIAHEVTGRFTMDPGKLTFSRFAVSTDMLSAVGQGDVGYDGTLALSVYADGRWHNGPHAEERKPGELYIPVLSDIGRALAAAGQYTVGSISRQFTHFTVTGTRDKPKVTLSPAPVLTEALERAFHAE